MIEKIKEKASNDPFIFQKTGLVVGSLTGLILGLVISDKADKQVFEKPEVLDGEEGN
ncbi:MAG: hypothetical protein GWO20_07660 [Candidatus Korarchaeota archaeon]|nr:hypothetical protein [Candidatus Korarchaeota archaeon]NIU82395.1 hypothetical protein [Candidatus Thorarchaeota archaeon]NIW12868.1 hypothetical protein [Candidatus Thorarchaeota archaeon]NIW51062.1 hypothetical protein [Candidatus Korarchaeota archaeon]